MKVSSVYVFGDQIDLPMLVHVSRLRSYVANRVSWHSHEGYEVLCLLDGATGYEFAGHEAVSLQGGHFLVVPPRLEHRGLHDIRSPCTICGLALKAEDASTWSNTTFSAAEASRLFAGLRQIVLRAHPFSPAMRWLVRRLMEETGAFAPEGSSDEARIALRALICAVLVEVMRQIAVPADEPKLFVQAAIEYLREHFQEPVRMDDLVRHVGFSRARLFDLFKAQTGLSPNDYLLRLRVDQAAKQLRETELSVTEIGLASGFSTGQYFSTVFSRYMGTSPKDFRKGVRPAQPVPLAA